jgi:hypothetical protein
MLSSDRLASELLDVALRPVPNVLANILLFRT